jgi:hypothetical protein
LGLVHPALTVSLQRSPCQPELHWHLPETHLPLLQFKVKQRSWFWHLSPKNPLGQMQTPALQEPPLAQLTPPQGSWSLQSIPFHPALQTQTPLLQDPPL